MKRIMYCENRISYRVQEGDSLYKLAKRFHTTVTELILLNSGVNPYNLQVGMQLIICPGEGYEEDISVRKGNDSRMRLEQEENPSEQNADNLAMPLAEEDGLTRGIVVIPGVRPGNLPSQESNQGSLRERMRMAWLTHVTLVKLYLVSFFENLASENAWKDAVQKNADEILEIFAQYYPATAMQRMRNLLLEHLRLTEEVAAGLKEDITFTGPAMQEWYVNAEEMASFLSRQTVAYEETQLRKMLYDHLDSERQQMEAYLDGDYTTDVTLFLESRKMILDLADVLASGLMAR